MNHSLLVYDITSDGKLTDNIGRPLPELGGSQRTNPIPNRNYSIKIIESRHSIYISITFFLNYRDFLGS